MPPFINMGGEKKRGVVAISVGRKGTKQKRGLWRARIKKVKKLGQCALEVPIWDGGTKSSEKAARKRKNIGKGPPVISDEKKGGGTNSKGKKKPFCKGTTYIYKRRRPQAVGRGKTV